MAHLEIKRFIEAPPQAAWDVITDLDRQRDWMVDLRRLEVTTEQRRGAGTVMDVTSELFGQPVVKDVMEITAWDPPHRMDVLHRGQFHGTGSFILQGIAGGTIFTWIEDFQPPLGALGELAFALVVRPHMLRVFARSMANVKRLAEERLSPAPDSS
jgi:hypothetical protein